MLGVDVDVRGPISPPPQAEFWRLATSPALGMTAAVEIVDAHLPSWSLTEDGLRLALPVADYADADTAYRAAWFAAERARAKVGHLYVHDAACVVGRPGALLLIGRGGAGKTSLALALASLAGALYVSGGHTPLLCRDGRVTTWGHTSFLHLRAFALVALIDVLPAVADALPATIVDWARATTSDDWDRKLAVPVAELPLRTTEDPAPLALVADVVVVPGARLTAIALEPGELAIRLSDRTANGLNGRTAIVDTSGALRLPPLVTVENDVIGVRNEAASLVRHVRGLRLTGSLGEMFASLRQWAEAGELRRVS